MLLKIGYQWVPVGTSAVGSSGYHEYQEDQEQISGAAYISDVVFVSKMHCQMGKIVWAIGKCKASAKEEGKHLNHDHEQSISINTDCFSVYAMCLNFYNV